VCVVNVVIEGDNLRALRRMPDGGFDLIYLDPPFNTGRVQTRRTTTAKRTEPVDETNQTDRTSAESGARSHAGFKGVAYERIRTDLKSYDDQFDDYWSFLEPRLIEAWRVLAPTGTLYVHLDYREAHYAKVLLDALFGRDSFINEIIWGYDFGGKPKNRWPAKHDTILMYVKDPNAYTFNADDVEREPYMAPGLVTPEKVARGKLPTDVWWHTIVSPTGKEKTGYPTQKPEGILRRIIAASSNAGDHVLDFFAGSGTTGVVAHALSRQFTLVDENPQALAVMRERFASLDVEFERAD
jgi:site-specific DNA-methyltransferase (adenine-specific)